ncbi:hypothetical protein [Klebsiella variicola]|uniref:hypothetical protein n=1 Tax=Klebsiella variicola TaxID=244366 RepID=UPI0035A89E7F
MVLDTWRASKYISDNNVPVTTTSLLVAMFTDFPAFPGAPNTANVHPDEVENWKAHGWKEME